MTTIKQRLLFLLLSTLTLSCVSMSSSPPHLSLHKIATFPKQLNETSGLIYYKQQLWTIVDDTYPVLYGINPDNGKLTKTIQLASASNHDFESLTQNKHAIFIGDIGNNSGNRKNLRIYGIKKRDIKQQYSHNSITVRPTIMSFHYPSQSSFSNTAYQHDFDSEAMLANNDTLTLINKNWQGKNHTQLYQLPIKPGSQALKPYTQIKSNMLITGATQKGNNVWFIGYRLGLRLQPYIEHFTLTHHRFKRINQWPLPVTGQFEGIAIGPHDTLFLTCETNASQQAALYDIPISAISR